MKKLILLPIVFLGFGFLYAQNSYLGKSDPQAKVILRNVTNKYKAYKTVSAKLKLEISNVQGDKLGSESGTLQLKGDKYYLDMGDQTSFSDGKSAYNYDRETKEITVTRIDPNDNMITPQKLFTEFYDKDYVYDLAGTGTVNGRSTNRIELTPRDKTMAFFKVTLEVDKANSSILSARIFEKNGNRYTYTITSPQYNQTISDSKFTYSASAYPGVELVDLR